jgi:hypothetical protein
LGRSLSEGAVIGRSAKINMGASFVLFRCSKDTSARHAIAAVVVGLLLSATGRAQYFTDTGSPANPEWSTILPTLNVASADPGPVYGSVINVNNALTEVGLYGNRSISVGTMRLHIPCNTSTTNFARTSEELPSL